MRWAAFSLVPHWNLRGEADNGSFADGALARCMHDGVGERCVQVRWPFGWTATAQQAYVRDLWHGSLLESKREGSGLLFRRTRSMDPATGRFTQEDPIGLAGGLNLYAFAAADPVNYSDPFGLCPNPFARGLGSLRCALEDIIGAIKAGPGLLLDAIKTSPHKNFVVGLAMVPFTVAEGGEALLFQGGKAALRQALRTSSIEGVSGAQGLSLLRRLKKGPVDDIAITAGGQGSIRAVFSRVFDDITEVTTRVYNRAGEEIGVQIRRFNRAGEEVY